MKRTKEDLARTEPEKKPARSGSRRIRALLGVLCLAALVYFGVQVYRYFADPLTTTACYPYQVEQSVSAAGYVVRTEQVLSGTTSGLVRLSRAEGERVSAGGEIALVYADQASMDREEEVAALQTRIEQLEYAQQSALSSEVSLKLDNQILSTIYTLRKNLGADQLDEAEESVTILRGLVLKRDYTYAGGGDSQDLAAQIKELKTQLRSLQASSAGAKRLQAPCSGIYSAVVDGYESVLTPASLEDLTPAALSSVQAQPTAENGLGKLILGDTWYYAASLSEADAADLKEGAKVTLRFTKGAESGYPMRVQSVSKPEGGRVAVVLSCSSYVQDVTLLRRQSSDLILSTVSGLRVPSGALRVNEDGQTGVYCISGRAARFKPVKVVYTGGDFALVSSAADTEKTRLRNGDEVIITANALYDGKVVI